MLHAAIWLVLNVLLDSIIQYKNNSEPDWLEYKIKFI